MASGTSGRTVDASVNDGGGAFETASAGDASSEIGDRSKVGLTKAVEAVGDLYAKGANLAHDAIDDLPANLSDAGVVGERLFLRGRQRLDRGVRRQPVEALLLAGALGYLVGWATIRD